MNSHDMNRAEDVGPAIIKAFYEGEAVREIAKRLGKSQGVVAGVLGRAGAVRHSYPGRESESFLSEESAFFVAALGEGLDLVAAAKLIGKSERAGRGHAKAMCLLKKPVEETLRLISGSGLTEERAIDLHRKCDERLVAALLREGGFQRYDDRFDWMLNHTGQRVAAISGKAKAMLAEMRSNPAKARGARFGLRLVSGGQAA